MSTATKIAPAVVVVAVAAAALLQTGCDGDGPGHDGATAGSTLPQGSERVRLDPAEFTTEIDNPYWPMRPGSRWVYSETDSSGAEQRVVVTVTHRTRRIANGVEARVVHDVVSQDGQLVEVTDDWYAQDAEGNVWYLGEQTAEYEHGRRVATAGSFEAGVDGAQAGVLLPANPAVGLAYRQEYYEGQAEDRAKVLALDAQAEVPFGYYDRALLTEDRNPLEPRVLELKLYARGVGPVLVLSASGGGGREELVRYVR